MEPLLVLIGLAILAFPFIMPLVTWASHRRTRTRVDLLEDHIVEQQRTIDALTKQVRDLRAGVATGVATPAATAATQPAASTAAPAQAERATAPPVTAAPAEKPSVVIPTPPAVTPPPVTPPIATPPKAAAAIDAAKAIPPASAPVAHDTATDRAAPLEERTPTRAQTPVAPPPSAAAAAPAQASSAAAAAAQDARPAPPSTPPPRYPVVPAEPPPPAPPFDWESLIGVKLFSAIAGIALVIAAIFFLRYSIEHLWLSPPVRVAIGVLVGVGLLVSSELKVARGYEETTNALDGAGIAILFATFFAAHALWYLIPASVAFGLLALVTAIAVLLSIRRESMFIAVLGLLGGFSTPALLSTGENQPVPLFAYLLLLNVGLAWVGYTRGWPVLAALSVLFTTVYQWGWVLKFLDASQLPLAVGIFLLFPIVTVAGLVLARPDADRDPADKDAATFERTSLLSSALPLLFAVFLASVPRYGPHAGLLFGFLLLVDAGLLAVALARRAEALHATGAVATVLVFAIWLGTSYHEDAYLRVLLLLLAFVPFYAFAPAIARWFDRPFTARGDAAVFAAPLLLAAPAVLAGTARSADSPFALFGVVFVLVALLAWRAAVTTRGGVYYVAAFFAVAAQAAWSVQHLEIERLGFAMGLYAAFGLLSFAVPIAARRAGRALQPPAGPGIVLLASLGLLLFLAAGPTAPAALWGLALLIAILDAGLFVESTAARLPVVSLAGSILSWFVLAVWWARSAASIGILPSLLVMLLLTLVMLAGHAWSYTQARKDEGAPASDATILAGFRSGVFLGLGGHLFLLYLASNPAWSIPPWPFFAVLGVVTLAVSMTSRYTRVPALHAGSAIGVMLVVLEWTATARTEPWPAIAIAAGGVATAFALAWMWVDEDAVASGAAGVALFLMEAVAIVAAVQPGAPALAVLIVSHAVTLAVLLAVTWRERWQYVAPLAVVPAWIAVTDWQVRHATAASWRGLLLFAAVPYAIFTAYPFVLGGRARESRDPYLAALGGAALFFFAARRAFLLGDLGWMMGAIPVFEGAVLAVLLRQLLSIEARGQRDLGRLALVAGASLAFATVAIPLQLSHQWITIGWALEGAALAWLYARIPHKGLLAAASGLMTVVFVRLAMNPAIFYYEPRGSLRIFNWYLYTYAVAAAACFAAAWLLAKTDDRIGIRDWRVMHLLSAAGAILLFLVLNIEIADYYATGPEIMFRFGTSVAQDLTYTIGWLVFGMAMLAAGIYLKAHAARVAALLLLTVTTFKAFLYDLGSLGGLYRVASLVGLAVSLILVSLALQRFVLRPAKEAKEQ